MNADDCEVIEPLLVYDAVEHGIARLEVGVRVFPKAQPVWSVLAFSITDDLRVVDWSERDALVLDPLMRQNSALHNGRQVGDVSDVIEAPDLRLLRFLSHTLNEPCLSPSASARRSPSARALVARLRSATRRELGRRACRAQRPQGSSSSCLA